MLGLVHEQLEVLVPLWVEVIVDDLAAHHARRAHAHPARIGWRRVSLKHLLNMDPPTICCRCWSDMHDRGTAAQCIRCKCSQA